MRVEEIPQFDERRRLSEATDRDRFFSVSVDMLAVVGFDGRFRRINEAWERTLGYDPEDLLSRPLLELVHPDDRDRTIAEMEMVKSGQPSSSFENRCRCRDGSYRWFLWRSVSYVDERLVYSVARDITEFKHTEEALHEADRRAIREYERLLELQVDLAQTLGSARDLLTIYRALRNFTVAQMPCSMIFIALYDAERESRDGVYLWHQGEEIDPTQVGSVPVGDGPAGRAIKTGELVVSNNYMRDVLGKPVVTAAFDVDERYPQSAVFAPMIIMGRTIGVVETQSYELGAYRTEHATAMRMAANLAANAIENVRLLENEREKEAQLQQAQKMDAVGKLAGGVAHDFNNLLTAINGYGALSLRKLQPGDPLHSNIQEIIKAGERAAALTRQLLAFSRKQVRQPKVSDLNDLIYETHKLLKRLIGENIEVGLFLDPALWKVKVDPNQIDQVVVNLAVNARDAMPRGGKLTIRTENVAVTTARVGKSLLSPGAYALVTVTDTGEGIDAETQKHIFEPFFTTKPIGRGTGLGLSTVYGIVKQSDGYVEVESELGRGAAFKIYLPRWEEPESIADADFLTDAAAEPPAARGTETVLLVEDEESVRRMTRSILEESGYFVIAAADGEAALDLGRRYGGQIHLILTDVVMPRMSGWQFVEQIRQSRPRVKVIYVSGYTDDAALSHGAFERGAMFLEKPFSPPDLLLKVREVLDEA